MRRSSLLLLAVLVITREASESQASPCGEENLLAGRSPIDWRDVFRPEMLTDTVVARDGDPEQGTHSAVLISGRGQVEYDLDGEQVLTAALVQAGATAIVALDLSRDRRTWERLATLGPGRGKGLETRIATGLRGGGRYLRMSVTGAGGAQAVSEAQVFCRSPAKPPVVVKAAQAIVAPAEVAREQARRGLLLLLPLGAALLLLKGRARARSLDRLALLLAIAAFVLALAFSAVASAFWTAAACGGMMALVAAAVAFASDARGSRLPGAGLSRTTAALLIGVAAMAYVNYGRFGGYWSVHYHDVLHYALGAKYAPELRYDGIYACLLEANAVEARWTSVAPSVVRDLHDDRLVPAAEFAHRKACQGRFSPERWQSFRGDVAFFAGQLSPGAWTGIFSDHGYNATPVWTWLWRPMLGTGPISNHRLELLAHIDEVIFALMVLGLLWAWGPDVSAMAAAIFGLGAPWIYLWTGGGMGRSLWLFALVMGLALAARRKHVAAGVALGAAGALQLFPVLVLAGPAVLAGRRDQADEARAARRLLLAAVATGLALVLLACAVAGPSLWFDFARNTARQASSESLNRIGLAVVTRALGLPALVGWLVFALALGIWMRSALRARGVARLLALSLLVPMFALRLSSYYLVMSLGLSPLLDSRGRTAAALLAILVLPQALMWIAEGHPGPATYAWISASILGLAISLCVLEARRTHPPSARP